ncbi:MAG: 23S rRNA (adenine(2503)-C(2))-methyltransferase RlmN [Candidatus Pelagibacterales bacterium]|jgi:23S rRNA (adenine2503-C2)-methyltransferase|tara:strand:+ start:373 stop:1470 length:1098 start_codon:yes stop_codon:yes gene_type:complete
MTNIKTNIIGLSRDEIKSKLIESDLIKSDESFRVKQIWHWLYFHGVTSIDDMTSISAQLREELKKVFSLQRPNLDKEQHSVDGTKKWLIKLSDGNLVETVYIPEDNRGTLCVSSQVGCTLNCKFCHTGTQKLVRNLTTEEIVSQLMIARDQLKDWPANENRKISNIVFMGMGEPLYNYDAVKKSVQIFSDPEGIKLSTKRITLSTSGIVPQILEWGNEVDTVLAISLHATNDDLRNEIVPINKKYPLQKLIQACRDYPRSRNSRRITFEYVMLKGVNDSLADAQALVDLIEGIPAKINLIPFNPWPNSPYECSSNNQIKKFGDFINDAGYSSPVRKTRGQDIMAACGQLKSDSIKVKKSLRRLEI